MSRPHVTPSCYALMLRPHVTTQASLPSHEAAEVSSREEPQASASALLGGHRSGRSDDAAAADAADAADADASLGWGRAGMQRRWAPPVEVTGVPVDETLPANAPVVSGIPLARQHFAGNDPPPPPPPPPERAWLLEWPASSSSESAAGSVRPRHVRERRGGDDSDGTTLRTVAQHSSLLSHRGGVVNWRAARSDGARAGPAARRRRVTP